MFNNWALSISGMLGSGGLTLDGVSEGKNIVESGVLKGVWVDVNHSGAVSNSGCNEFGVSL